VPRADSSRAAHRCRRATLAARLCGSLPRSDRGRPHGEMVEVAKNSLILKLGKSAMKSRPSKLASSVRPSCARAAARIERDGVPYVTSRRRVATAFSYWRAAYSASPCIQWYQDGGCEAHQKASRPAIASIAHHAKPRRLWAGGVFVLVAGKRNQRYLQGLRAQIPTCHRPSNPLGDANPINTLEHTLAELPNT
jgi:hypothetical protein